MAADRADPGLQRQAGRQAFRKADGNHFSVLGVAGDYLPRHNFMPMQSTERETIMSDNTLTAEQAHAIYDVLVDFAGARESGREDFVWTQTNRHCSEYRFMGNLGFGGKFWRNTGRRGDGSYGEVWYVNCYHEDETPERREMIDNINYKLDLLMSGML